MPTGGWELVVLILIIVVIFGAKKLPEASRSLGRSLRIFKSEMNEMNNDDKPAAPQAQLTQQDPAQAPIQPQQQANPGAPVINPQQDQNPQQ